MKPASTTRSGALAAIAAVERRVERRRASRRPRIRSLRSRCRCAAASRKPAASARLLITVAIGPAERARRSRGDQRAEVRAAARNQYGDARRGHGGSRCDARGSRARVRRRRSPARRPPRGTTLPIALTRLAGRREQRLRARRVGGGDDHDHADAAVEDAVHLGLGDVALRAAASRRSAGRGHACASRRAATPSGSMRGACSRARPPPVMCAMPLTSTLAHQREHRLHVDARRREQRRRRACARR